MVTLLVVLFVQVRQGTQPGEKVVLRGKGRLLELQQNPFFNGFFD